MADASSGLYSKYYDRHSADRNDILTNPEVLFQAFALERSLVRALRPLSLDRPTARVLDVGCGSGSGLLQFVKLGFNPAKLAGVDLSAERLSEARTRVPAADLRMEDAQSLSFGDGEFDVVFESTMFVLLPDEAVAQAIAAEMIRVTKPGRFIVLVDWRYSRPGSDVYRAMSLRRIRALFGVGKSTRVLGRERGALVPPLGRFLSRRLPGLYFAAQALLPPASGQMATVLEKLKP